MHKSPIPVINYISRMLSSQRVARTPDALDQEAVDTATTLFNCLLDGLLYVNLFWILSLAREHIEQRRNLMPESAEGEFSSSEGEIEHSSQNVKFLNTHPGYTQTVLSTIDELRNAPLTSDASLNEFFSRPLRIQSYSWAVNSDFFQTFNPWADYWENLRVINRIANYKLMRCKLHVKFVINGNGFYYGRAICAYHVLPFSDTLTVIRQFVSQDLIAASQRPHVFLDPTNSQGGDLCLPFFTYYNLLDIPDETWNNMGTITIKSMQNLQHANGANTPITVNVFAWATDVSFAIPTHFEPGSIAPQSGEILPEAKDEYSTKPVSRIAGAIAKAAGMLQQIPVIGPFATATQIGANAIGAIATLFGYSKPQILDTSMYQPKTKANLAAINAPEDSTKLSLDIKQELSIDPRIAGLDGRDELAINFVASRESYLTQFDWNIGTVQEALLWNCLVDPCLLDTVVAVDTEYHLPACSFATQPFQYWRGTMKFRFQVVSSNFHKGRLKVVYDPTGTALTAGVPVGSPSAEYNTAYTTIVDISDNTDFEIKVGWGQQTTYRERLPFPPPVTMFDTIRLAYNTSAAPYANGTIAVYVVNELTTPNSAVAYDISVNVFISMDDDFEVACPTAAYLPFMRFHTAPEEVGVRDILPQSADGPSEELSNMGVPPVSMNTIDTMGLKINTSDNANLVHFGERVSSLRQLLKRYCMHELIAANDSSGLVTDTMDNSFHRYMYPTLGGYYPANTVVTSDNLVWAVPGPAGLGNYVYTYMTYLNYISLAYGGKRGGVRWIVDATGVSTSTVSLTVNRVTTRDTLDFPRNQYVVSGDISATTADVAVAYSTGTFQTAMSGSALQSSAVNSTLSFECPYYSKFRFKPAKRYDYLETDDSQLVDPYQDQFIVGLTGTGIDVNRNLRTYCSAAEDFTCFMFLGAPRIYLQAFFPS